MNQFNKCKRFRMAMSIHFRLVLLIFFLPNTLKTSFNEFFATLQQKNSSTQSYQSPVINKDMFLATVQQFKEVQFMQLTNQVWLDGRKLGYLNNKNNASFESFAQKVVVPENAQVALWGDLHGSAHSFMNCLLYLQQQGYLNDELVIQKDDFYMFFLGDFVDRGMFGVEIMYMILMLKIKNPQHVFLIRGNHEDMSLNKRSGFQQELATKYPSMRIEEFQDVYDAYNFMPAVVYLGKTTGAVTEFIQCCHGGLELGFNAKKLLDASATVQVIRTVNRHDELKHLSSSTQHDINACIPARALQNRSIKSPFDLGFLWNDFCCDTQQQNYFNPGRGWIFKESWAHDLLQAQSSQNNKLCAVFRAHQHHGRMLELLIQQRGIVRIFDNLVTTFLSARINGFNFDSFGILTRSNSFDKWQLNHIVLND